MATSTPPRAVASGARFLDPAVLARIDNLELLARTVVDGFLAGLHRSPYLGFSLDFAEHRPYMPGDDIRRIDWRLFARTDRHYIKLFEAETNANFVVLLDVSRSMSYTSHTVTSWTTRATSTAALCFLSRRQRDRVGLVTFDDAIVDYVPPSMKHMDTVLHVLDRVEAGRAGPWRSPSCRSPSSWDGRGSSSSCRTSTRTPTPSSAPWGFSRPGATTSSSSTSWIPRS